VKLPLEAAAVMLVALGAVYVFQNTPELQQAARQEPPVSAPVPVSPPATPAPPAVPAVRGTPAPSPSAPAEAHRTAEEDQAGRKKEREAALSDAPAKAEAPPSRPVTPPAPRLEARPEAKLQSKVDARKTPVAPEGRSDAREAPPAATNLMKDKAPSQSPAAPPAPPAAAAPPADVAPEAREKSGARPQSEVSRPLDRVGPSESSGICRPAPARFRPACSSRPTPRAACRWRIAPRPIARSRIWARGWASPRPSVAMSRTAPSSNGSCRARCMPSSFGASRASVAGPPTVSRPARPPASGCRFAWGAERELSPAPPV